MRIIFFIAAAIATAHTPAFAQRSAGQEGYDAYMREQRERMQQRRSQPDSSFERSKERYETYLREQRERQDKAQSDHAAATAIRKTVTAIEVKIENLDQLKATCEKALRDIQPYPSWISIVRGDCNNLYSAIQTLIRNKSPEATKEEMAALIQKMDTMSIDELRHMYSNNRYRLPNLSFSQQNTLYDELGRRISEQNTQTTENRCAPVAAKVSLPDKMHDAIIVDGLEGISVRQFLCGAILQGGGVSAKVNGKTMDINVRRTTLTFDINHFSKGQGGQPVPVESPVEGGVTVLSLGEAKESGRPLNIGRPEFFVINFYSQWTPELSAFLNQRQ